MDQKMTPGPWTVGFSDGTGQTYILAGDHPARPVEGVVTVVSGATDDWGVHHGVRNPADARAIAAVPDLIAALDEIAALTGARLDEAALIATRALAKAR